MYKIWKSIAKDLAGLERRKSFWADPIEVAVAVAVPHQRNLIHETSNGWKSEWYQNFDVKCCNSIKQVSYTQVRGSEVSAVFWHNHWHNHLKHVQLAEHFPELHSEHSGKVAAAADILTCICVDGQSIQFWTPTWTSPHQTTRHCSVYKTWAVSWASSH